MSDTEFDVVIAAYLIPDLAQQDFDALVKLVGDKQLTVEGVALVTHDADGKVTVTETGDARSLQYPAAALAAAAPKDRADPDPDEANGSYDLVCFGSPTWFFRTCMPLRSYLKSDEARRVLAGKPFAAYVVCRRYWSINLKEVRTLGTGQGGEYLDGIRFTYEGGQIRSLLSLLSYFGKGEMRERSLGIKIPADQSQAGL